MSVQMAPPIDSAPAQGGQVRPPFIDPATGQPIPPENMAVGGPPQGPPMPDPSMMGGPAAPMQPPGPPMPPPRPEDLILEVLMNGTAEDVLELIEPLQDTELAMLRELLIPEIEKVDPQRANYLIGFLPEKREGGRLPQWMKTPPARPSANRVNELANLDAEEWSEVVKNDRNTQEYLIPPYRSEVFPWFDPKKHTRYKSPMLLNEIKLIVAKGSASEYRYEIPFTDPAHKEATQQCEDFLYDCDRKAARSWADAGNGDVEMDAWYTLATKGRVIRLIQPVVESEDCFFVERLMDPSNTYPTWAGERGLERVTRMYQTTAAEVIGDFDPTGDLGVEGKIIGQVTKNKNRVYENDTRGTVTQYWDRWWYVVLFDGIEVVNVAHKFGFVPFVVTAGNTGLPKYMSEINLNGDPITTRMRDTLKKAKYASYIDHMKEFAGIREQIGTVFLTIMSRMDNPAKTLYQDSVAQAKGAPVISDERGEVNLLEIEREKLEAGPDNTTPPQTFQPFYQMFGQDASMTFLPEAAHGVIAGANQSGNALENLFEVGNDKFVGMYKAMARHKEAVASMRLAFWRDWGHVWKDARGEYGRMMVPYPSERRGQMSKTAPPAYEFLPETVDMVGTTVECDYTSVRMQNLTQLGNAVMIWQQAKAMSAREAMELRGVRNPEAVFDQLIYEQILTDPDIMKLKALDSLQKHDPELAAKFEEMIAGGSPGNPNQEKGAGPNSSAMNLAGMGKGAQGPTGRPGMGGPGVAPVGVE